MKKQIQKNSPEFKARVTLDATKGVKTVSKIAREYEIHPVMISNWKKEMMNFLPDISDKDQRPIDRKDIENENVKLQRKVGELTMDFEFLEKSAGSWESPSKIEAYRKRFT